jgi:hypothetical protein
MNPSKEKCVTLKSKRNDAPKGFTIQHLQKYGTKTAPSKLIITGAPTSRKGTQLVVILAGALFYTTVTFSFFCSFQIPKVLYLRYYVIYHTSKVYTRMQKNVHFPPSKQRPSLTAPPIFITTPPLCMVMCHPCSGQAVVYLILH